MEQLEKLNSAMSNLATDNDRDVAGKARGLNDLFKKTPVRPFLPLLKSSVLSLAAPSQRLTVCRSTDGC